MIWDKFALERLRQMVEVEKLSAGEAAIALQTTRGAIVGVCHRKGIQLSSNLNGPRTQSPAPRPGPRVREVTVPKIKSAPLLPSEKFQIELDGFDARYPFHTCQWPEGDVGEPGFHLCGARREHGAYCFKHAARAYRRPGERR